MKKGYILPSLICLLAVSCTVRELDVQVPSPIKGVAEEDVFFASFEPNSTPDTKVFIDENIKMHWSAEDQLSIFNFNTQNQKYQFSGETGAVSGYFTRVSGAVETEDNLDFIYAVYPYQESTSISDAGVLTLTFPAKQTYKAGSFDPKANVMVSTTDGHFLKFKNVGGYLAIKLVGSDVSVSSIRLDGLNGEKLSGEATVSSAIVGNPVVTMTSTTGTPITLTCEEPVTLTNDPTIFWMVVPPTSFTQGFRLTVTDTNGNVFFKETDRTDLSITRNNVFRISPIGVVMNSANLSIGEETKPITDGINHAADNNINFKTEVDEDSRTVTVTMPTVTNFSNLVFNYDIPNGATVMVDGQALTNGVTPIDASSPVTLTVRNGNYGINFTLIARNTGLPVVRITTPCAQGDITKEDWVAGASICIENADGSLDLKTTETEIKGRGNASWTYNKKPYALRLKKKKEVLGMKEHKRWILLANWKDRTLLRNDAAFWLSQQVSDSIKSPSFPYTVHGQFVELEFNGVHRGNYYLCEQIKIDKNRVNITKLEDDEVGSTDPYIITGPYIMEIDNNFDEQFKFRSGFYGNSSTGGLKYMFHDPDEDLTEAAVTYMKNYIQNMESFIKKIPNNNFGYRSFIDMDSAIWFMFVNELTGNGDFFNTDGNVGSTYYGPHSTFLYKDRDKFDGTAGKLFMGPVWDFDYLTFYDKSGSPSRSNKWVGVSQSNYYYYYFTQDSLFRKRTQELWRKYKPRIESATLSYIDEMKNHLTLSEKFNTKMWEYNGTDQFQNGDNEDDFDTAVTKMKSAFTTKLNFMNTKIEHGTVNDYRN